jgi:hypothetical protein
MRWYWSLRCESNGRLTDRLRSCSRARPACCLHHKLNLGGVEPWPPVGGTQSRNFVLRLSGLGYRGSAALLRRPVLSDPLDGTLGLNT